MQDLTLLQPDTLFAERFHIVRFVAAGGMGAIYEALQLPLRRKVALKVIRQDVGQAQMLVARFEREAETVARLTHTHTITLFDYGVTADGLMFIVMEWLDGRDLGAELKRHGAIAPQRAARIAAQIARSLAEAHDIGVIHRDLKPENIFLTERDGQADFVKVLDFGIVKNTNDVATQITRIGAVCGTPHFMSPEQALGEDLDGRSDIYSLGTVLYTMLNGEPPFDSPSLMQIILRHQTEHFPSLGPHVPAALQAIVQRATAKRAEDRHPSAAELAAELEAFALHPDAPPPFISATPTPSDAQPAFAPAHGAPLAEPPAPPRSTHAGSLPQLPPLAPSPRPKPFLIIAILALVAILLLVAAALLFFGHVPRPHTYAVDYPTAPSQSSAEAGAADHRNEAELGSAPTAGATTAADPEAPSLPAPQDCPAGMLSLPPTGACCWPGQRWSTGLHACAGFPTACTADTLPTDAGCVPAPADLLPRVGKCHAGAFLVCFDLAEALTAKGDEATADFFFAQAQGLAHTLCNDEGDAEACAFARRVDPANKSLIDQELPRLIDKVACQRGIDPLCGLQDRMDAVPTLIEQGLEQSIEHVTNEFLDAIFRP